MSARKLRFLKMDLHNTSGTDNTSSEPSMNGEEMSTNKIKPKKYYKCVKKYNPRWETDHVLKSWIARDPGNIGKAFCRFCFMVLRAHKTDLLEHSQTLKHQRNYQKKVAPEDYKFFVMELNKLKRRNQSKNEPGRSAKFKTKNGSSSSSNSKMSCHRSSKEFGDFLNGNSTSTTGFPQSAESSKCGHKNDVPKSEDSNIDKDLKELNLPDLLNPTFQIGKVEPDFLYMDDEELENYMELESDPDLEPVSSVITHSEDKAQIVSNSLPLVREPSPPNLSYPYSNLPLLPDPQKAQDVIADIKNGRFKLIEVLSILNAAVSHINYVSSTVTSNSLDGESSNPL